MAITKMFYGALDDYLTTKGEQGLKEYSIQSTSQRVKLIKKTVADIELAKITTEKLQEWVVEWQKLYAVNTIKAMKTVVKETLKIKGKVLGSIKITKNELSKIKTYTAKEISLIEEYFKKSKIKENQLAIPIALYTGLRIGEILALQWKDIDVENAKLRVNKTAEFIAGKGMVLQSPKTKSSNRDVAIPQQLCEILGRFKFDNDPDAVVVGGNLKPINTRGIMKSSQHLVTKIGVEWKGFHAFRHTYATTMLEKNIPAKIVADLLGHSTVETTLNIYSHTSQDLKKETVNKVFGAKEEQTNEPTQDLTLNEKESIYKQLQEMQKAINSLIVEVKKLKYDIY